MSDKHDSFFDRIEYTAVLTVIGIILLFSGAVIVTLFAPAFVDPSWTQPNSYYQVQMYEVADPNVYIARTAANGTELEFVNHLKNGYTLLAFKESPALRFVAPPELDRYITRQGEQLKLTSRLLLLRTPQTTDTFDAVAAAAEKQVALGEEWEKQHPDWKEKGLRFSDQKIMELYDPQKEEAFSLARNEGVQEDWVDENYSLLEDPVHAYQKDPGVVYVKNPEEYLLVDIPFGRSVSRRYDPKGKPVQDLNELKNDLGFRSRAELISLGEQIFAIEGCWYCHTDQSRTLIQDCVLNGSESFAAPPSSANEYIYQKITFPGTRRIGPDIARVGVKRPSRDWHKTHFWEPKSASVGTIMPAFRHFFDDDPRGNPTNAMGIPNYRFEAMFQYLMTKGTRITPPSQAWWLGRDPVNTTELIQRGIEANATR